jgi:hypothetical protein
MKMYNFSVETVEKNKKNTNKNENFDIMIIY